MGSNAAPAPTHPRCVATVFHAAASCLLSSASVQQHVPDYAGLLLSRPRAFREDASSVLTSVRQPAPATATDTTPQPLWKKPSFPFVALIALTTLPFDLAATRQSGAPPRRAKPTTAGTAKSGPAPDIAAVRQQAAVAAAAAGQGHSSAASSAAGAGPAVDSWDAAGGDVSDEDAEQQAKAMVIELLTNPKVRQLRGTVQQLLVQHFVHPVRASMS